MTLSVDLTAWAWPQWVYVGLFVFNVVMAAALDGQPRTGKHSAGVTLVGTALAVFILASGGFFA